MVSALPSTRRTSWEMLGNLARAAKGAAAKVRVSGRRDDAVIVLSVKHHGPGVPEDRIGIGALGRALSSTPAQSICRGPAAGRERQSSSRKATAATYSARAHHGGSSGRAASSQDMLCQHEHLNFAGWKS